MVQPECKCRRCLLSPRQNSSVGAKVYFALRVKVSGNKLFYTHTVGKKTERYYVVAKRPNQTVGQQEE